MTGNNNSKTIILATGTGVGTGCILTNGETTLVPTLSKVLESNDFNNIQSISTSTEATYFINNGRIYSFGKGQLGNGDSKEKKTIPEEISYLKDIKNEENRIRFNNIYSSTHKENNFCFLQGENGVLLSFGNSLDFRTALGSEIESNLPRYVSGLDSPVKLVSLGICHGVILTELDSIYLFGRPFGFDSEPIPTPIKFNFKFSSPDNSQTDPLVQIISGEEFTLFLTETGKVYGIGNGESQCLLDPEDKLEEPTLLSFIPEPIKQISCGNSHCLALSITNKLYSWGLNQNGSLGINQQNYSFSSNSRVEMIDILNVKNICSSLYQNFVIDENNDVYSWGYNVYGNLGTNNNRNYIIPEKIKELSNINIESISIGQYYTLFLCKENSTTFKPNGYINNNKSISNNTTPKHLYPDIPNFIYNNSIQNNSVWCTGSIFATNNEIGDDQMNFKPMTSLQSYQISSVAIGNRCGYMITNEGDVYCWGSGYALGQGMKGEPCKEITRIYDLPSGKSVKVFASSDDVCFVTNEKGNLYSFGKSKNFLTGQGSDEEDVGYPRLMEGFKSACGISKVVISNTHCLALDKEGNIYAWGTGKALGNRSRSTQEKQAKKIQDQAYLAIDIACGNNFSLYLSDSGKVFSFGEGLKGQLGQGDNKFSSLPTLITKLKDERVVSISASHSYASAITEKGELYFWGNNPDEVLNFIDKPEPNANIITLSVPTLAPRFTNQQLHHMVLSEKNIFAISTKGSLYAWGEPHLGIGSGIKVFQPTLVESTQSLCVQDIKASDWQCLCIISKKSQDPNIKEEQSLKLPELNHNGTLLSPPTSPNGSIIVNSLEGNSSNNNNNNTEAIDPEEITRHEDYIKKQTDEVRFWNHIDQEIDINTWCGKIQEIKDFLNRTESYQYDPHTLMSIQDAQKVIKAGERVLKGWLMYSINHKDYEAERILIVTTENIYRVKYDWKKLIVLNYKVFPLANIHKVKIGRFTDWKPMMSSNFRKGFYDKEYGIQIWFSNPSQWKPPSFVNPFAKKLNYPYITLRPAINLNLPTAFEDQQLVIHEIGTAIQCAIHYKRNSNKPIELLHKFARESPSKWNELTAFPVRKVEQLQRFGANGLLSYTHNKFIAKTQNGFIDPTQNNATNNNNNNNNNNNKK